ncbi:hypothetical protein OHA72_55405 [Dactylosporangium sp. NBC_01737]|uniref:hypothetical protein n=1 Tax=Dactylosporangium sp. NBC_01737 TaxID=2975959 RepID=UPI002E147033|nr:hypothetical protein OHA72_55405 [Dactylosporangium sp. NBC_01737]
MGLTDIPLTATVLLYHGGRVMFVGAHPGGLRDPLPTAAAPPLPRPLLAPPVWRGPALRTAPPP